MSIRVSQFSQKCTILFVHPGSHLYMYSNGIRRFLKFSHLYYYLYFSIQVSGVNAVLARGKMWSFCFFPFCDDYGQNDHNRHFGHNCHICLCGHNHQNEYYSLIWVSIEAYGLQESSLGLRNHLKYFFQIQKGKK